MNDTSADVAPPVERPLPTDRRTLLCVGLGGATSAIAAHLLSDQSAWRHLAFDARFAGIAVITFVAGLLFQARARVGDRWFGFLVFGVGAGLTSVGVYAVIGLIAVPPAAGVRFLLVAPVAAALGFAAAAGVVRIARAARR
ncbi:hypothetical protein [Tsukamurella sp. 1534]|uniref:hypothetical protein n=1 Tax=Tsukamurella sp. 1534 TaxID=1151061 RepID=UPI00059510BD|nr:hypothetical protein [Tsukamurella sp. 1534]